MEAPKIRTIKWTIAVVTGFMLIVGFTSKIIQIFYLKRIGWDMISYSTEYIFSIFIMSLAYLSLTFLDRGVHKNSLKSPTQIFFLVSGVIGLLYSIILTILKIKDLGWLT